MRRVKSATGNLRLNTVIGAVFCVILGISIGFALGGRYEFRTYAGVPMRCDRWTGGCEIVTPKWNPVRSTQIGQSRPVPVATPIIDFSALPDQPTSTPKK